MERLIRQFTFYLGLMALWQGICALRIIPMEVLPSPLQVFHWLFLNVAQASFWGSIALSMERILTGYSVGLILGILVGISMSHSSFLESTLGPLILGLQTVPNICWVPLLLLWFGPSESAIIANIVMGSFLAITIATDSGFKGVPRPYLNAARNMGAQGMTLSLHVTLPAALPAIVSGMKQGWAFAWRGLISAEMIFASFGLGNLLMKGKDAKDMVQVMALMIVIVFLGWLVNQALFARLELWIRKKWGLQEP